MWAPLGGWGIHTSGHTMVEYFLAKLFWLRRTESLDTVAKVTVPQTTSGVACRQHRIFQSGITGESVARQNWGTQIALSISSLLYTHLTWVMLHGLAGSSPFSAGRLASRCSDQVFSACSKG